VPAHVVLRSLAIFMLGRNVHDGVVTLHKRVHKSIGKRLMESFKIDFGQAYGTVKWFFYFNKHS
jgi:hypothetical protein